MLPQESDAVQMWLALINNAPKDALYVLRKIHAGLAEIVSYGRQTSREAFTKEMCYNSSKLFDFLTHEFGSVASTWKKTITPDATLLQLGVRLEQLLHKCVDGEEAGKLYCLLMEGPVPKGLLAKRDNARLVITERRVEHLWRAAILHSPQTAKEIFQDILNFRAFIGNSAQTPDRVLFQVAHVWDVDMVSRFLSGIHDLPSVEELLNRYPPGEAGDFHRVISNFLYQHFTKEEGCKVYSMFFEKDPSPEIEAGAVKSKSDHSGLVEPIPTLLSKTYADFLACGQQLGIPITTLSILLPSETRKKLMMEVLSELTHDDRGVTP